MKIPVLGMDPSLNNWGLAASTLCMETGYLETPQLTLISPDELKGKQVRANSKDLHRSQQLAKTVIEEARKAKVVFVEVPVGSQSARAMASYGICVGVLGALRALGIQLIEVTPTEVKTSFTGFKTATKQQMIDKAIELYPDANYPVRSGKVVAKAEHLADAIASIHAGVETPTFQNLMKLFKGIT